MDSALNPAARLSEIGIRARRRVALRLLPFANNPRRRKIYLRRPAQTKETGLVLRAQVEVRGCVAVDPRGITTAVLQVNVIDYVIDFHINVKDAVDFPRIQRQRKPDRLECEIGVSPDTISVLKQMDTR